MTGLVGLTGHAAARIFCTGAVHTDLTRRTENTSTRANTLTISAGLTARTSLVLTSICRTCPLDTELTRRAITVLCTGDFCTLFLHTELVTWTVFVELTGVIETLSVHTDQLARTGHTCTWVCKAGILEGATDTTVFALIASRAVVGLTITFDTDFTDVTGLICAGVGSTLTIDTALTCRTIGIRTGWDTSVTCRSTEFIWPTGFATRCGTFIVFTSAVEANLTSSTCVGVTAGGTTFTGETDLVTRAVNIDITRQQIDTLSGETALICGALHACTRIIDTTLRITDTTVSTGLSVTWILNAFGIICIALIADFISLTGDASIRTGVPDTGSVYTTLTSLTLHASTRRHTLAIRRTTSRISCTCLCEATVGMTATILTKACSRTFR